jgi:MscS family membrane protein
MDEFLATKLLGTSITMLQVGYVLLAIALGLLTSWLFKLALAAVAKRSNEASIRGAVILALEGPLRWAILMAALWIAYVVITSRSGEELADVLNGEGDGIQARLSYQIFFASELPFLMWFGVRLTNNLTDIWLEKAAHTEGTFDDQLVPVVRTLAKLGIFIVGLLMIIQNLGGEVGSVLAGLGIGGAAIALASKDTIANLFGSIVIFVDRPFQVGDWVEIGEQEGTVEQVGLRVTRIRTFANSLITVPNSTLTTTAINNWSRMRKRRIKLTLGVTYASTPAQVQAGVAAIREVLHADRRISQDFMLVNFTNFGASSLDIFIYAFTLTTRWDEYMQVREELLLEFMRRFEALGLSFAFPSQSLYIESLPPGAPEAMNRELPQ